MVALEPDSSETVGAGAIRRRATIINLDITIAQEFGEKIGAADAAFDLVHARQVLHYARDLLQFCRERFRVLKQEGVPVSTRDQVISGPEQLPAFLDSHLLHRYSDGENAFRLSEYKATLRDAGLIIDKVIGPFDSVINYAPFSRSSLREALIQRCGRMPGADVLARVVLADIWFDAILKLLSRVDRRPGRPYSFLCRKPGDAS